MKNKLLIGALSVGLVFSYGSLSAQERTQNKPTHDPEEIFKRLDTDGSGMLDLEEAKQGKKGKLAKHFNDIDVNEDGLISREELKVRRKQRPGPPKN